MQKSDVLQTGEQVTKSQVDSKPTAMNTIKQPYVTPELHYEGEWDTMTMGGGSVVEFPFKAPPV